MQGHSEDKRSPGQPFKAPRAETWNGMVEAGNAYRAGLLSDGGPPPRTRPRSTDTIKLKNSSGANRARGEILRFNGKAITDLSDENCWLIGSAPTESGYFGILKEPIESNGVGDAQVSGWCMATVDIADADHTRARAIAGQYVLESAHDGPLEIIYKPSGTGEIECVVRFGFWSGAIVIMTPSGGIPARSGTTVGKADCSVYIIDASDELTDTGVDIEVVNLAASAVAGSVYAQAKRAGGRLVCDYEECEE